MTDKCIICEKTKKYKCPGCLRLTCSLGCIREHKRRFSCDGKDSHTKYIPRDEYNINHLMRDYTFLQDVERTIDNVSRNLGVNKKNNRNVQKMALLRGIEVKLMPSGLSRHENNKTRYIKSLDQIAWTVEFKFDDDMLTVHNILDSHTLTKTLEQHNRNHSDMHFYLLESNKWITISPDTPLTDVLRNHTIIEYPTIKVTAKQLHQTFECDYEEGEIKE